LLSQHPLQLVGEQIEPPLDAEPLLDVDVLLLELEVLEPDELLEPLLEGDESSPASRGPPSSLPLPLLVPPLLVGPFELEDEP
jgi:hypothetical protein